MDFKNYLITELTDDQNEEYIETTIISILKEHKLSLSQARCVFHHILVNIEKNNQITL